MWQLTYLYPALHGCTASPYCFSAVKLLQVSVAGQRPDQYLESFSWDEAKYPPRRALNETVSAITETTQKLEDDLKVSCSTLTLCSPVPHCLRGAVVCLLPASIQ